MRYESKNIVHFTESILKTIRMRKLNRYAEGGKVCLKSFPGSKTKQLNHTIPILEQHKSDAAAIHDGINIY